MQEQIENEQIENKQIENEQIGLKQIGLKQINKDKYYCYILFQTNLESDLTYNGSTNNLVRRLRQHNGEISGEQKLPRVKVHGIIW